jgi:stage V sporulation protein AD
MATTFGVKDFEIPIFGLYGACSTMGESISLGAMAVNAGYARKVLALTSSHFAGAEKNYRFPLDYGNQKPLASTSTVTGAGGVILSDECVSKRGEYSVVIKAITTGKIVDYGVKDSMNMGACMAPAAADVIYHNLLDMNFNPCDYDKIITGDLGEIGADILKDIMKEKAYDIEEQHMDCGVEIYYSEVQGTYSGGSGCGCSAETLCGYIFGKLKKGEWKRVLFVPTGALLSPVSFNEGESVPGIAHGVVFEAK